MRWMNRHKAPRTVPGTQWGLSAWRLPQPLLVFLSPATVHVLQFAQDFENKELILVKGSQ